MSNFALVQHSLDDAFNWRLKEHRHVRPQKFKLAKFYVATLVVISGSAKFDILWFVGIGPEPEFRVFVEAGNNMFFTLLWVSKYYPKNFVYLLEGQGTRKSKLVTLYVVQRQILKGKGLQSGNNKSLLFMVHPKLLEWFGRMVYW